MDAVAFPLLDYLTLRDGLRLSSTNHVLRSIVLTTMMAWIARCGCNCRWVRGRRLDSYVPVTRPLRFTTLSKATAVQRGSYMYHPRLPDNVMHQLKHKLCRECLTPCQSFARTSTGRLVLVCKSCSIDPFNYSAMCGRERARKLLRQHVANVDRAIRRLRVVRRGGNRAHLYWVHDIEHRLLTKRRTAMAPPTGPHF